MADEGLLLPGQRFQGHHHAKHLGARARAPRPLCGQLPSGAYMPEFFAGTARLTAASAEAGHRIATPVDLQYGSCFDLSKNKVQNLVLTWIRTGLFWLVWFPPSPSPLTLTTRLQPPAKILRQRGLGFQSVLPILSLVGLFACEHGAHLRSRRSTPRGHTLEKEELRRISEKANYSDYDYVSCWFGKAYRKPQRLRSNWPALAMGCMCMVLRSRPHEILEGKVRVDRDGRQQWFWKTTLAGA